MSTYVLKTDVVIGFASTPISLPESRMMKYYYTRLIAFWMTCIPQYMAVPTVDQLLAMRYV